MSNKGEATRKASANDLGHQRDNYSGMKRTDILLNKQDILHGFERAQEQRKWC